MQSTGVKMGGKKPKQDKQTITYKRQELEMTFQRETITNTQIKSKIPHKHQELQKDQPSASLYLYEQLDIKTFELTTSTQVVLLWSCDWRQDSATFGQTKYLVGGKLIRSLLPISLFKVTPMTSFQRKIKTCHQCNCEVSIYNWRQVVGCFHFLISRM